MGDGMDDGMDDETKRRIPESPPCAGSIPKLYGYSCSTICPYTAVCVLIVMQELMDRKMI